MRIEPWVVALSLVALGIGIGILCGAVEHHAERRRAWADRREKSSDRRRERSPDALHGVTTTDAGELYEAAVLTRCPKCGAEPFRPFLRFQVCRDMYSPWRALLAMIGRGRPSHALICWACKEIVGYE